jgi:hypothetical protein
MTEEARVHEGYYVEFVQSCWPGVFYVDTSMINSSVKYVCEQVWLQIRTCSSNLAIINPIFELFYSSSSLSELLFALDVTIIIPKPTIPGWFEELIGAGTGPYYICQQTVALYWKSYMSLALADILDVDIDNNVFVLKNKIKINIHNLLYKTDK